MNASDGAMSRRRRLARRWMPLALGFFVVSVALATWMDSLHALILAFLVVEVAIVIRAARERHFDDDPHDG